MQDAPKEMLPQTSDTIQAWQLQKEKIGVLLKSGLLPAHIRTVEQGMTIAEMGRAIGLKPIVAMNTMYVVGGKPTITPAMMLALAKQRGLVEDQKIERSATQVTFTILRKGYKTPHVETFGDDQAKLLGLLSKDNYKKQKTTMYVWRAVSAAMRFMFPDVIFGLYSPEEMGAIIDVDPENELGAINVREEAPAEIAHQTDLSAENLKSVRDEIMVRLAKVTNGSEEEMNIMLVKLTEHSDAKGNVDWIEIYDLDELMTTKPRWLLAIKEKMDAQKIGLETVSSPPLFRPEDDEDRPPLDSEDK